MFKNENTPSYDYILKDAVFILDIAELVLIKEIMKIGSIIEKL